MKDAHNNVEIDNSLHKVGYCVSTHVGRKKPISLGSDFLTGANGETPAVCKEVANAVSRKALRVGTIYYDKLY